MTAPAESPPTSLFDPEAYRMTLGDHLEELRRRLIYAMVGFAVATALCLFFGSDVLSIFCRPLVETLQSKEVNPQLVMNNVGDGFRVYLEISLICACVIASPWMIWQLWQFVAAGLYPNERETITRYVPLSVGLLIAGDLFVYYLILPLTLQFFIGFGLSIPLPHPSHPYPPPAASQPAFPQVPSLGYEPVNPPDHALWYDTVDRQLKIVIGGQSRVIPFGSDNLIRTDITLPDYIDLVLSTLLIFGLSFQLPLVVLALTRVNVVDVPTLRRIRRMVYFGLAVLACVAIGGDAVTAATGLLGPLIFLYELGIWLSARADKADAAKLTV